jgi:small nuclear ribonucleoprotein (snRNP)-like protein
LFFLHRKPTFGFRKVHQNLEDEKGGISRPSLLMTLSKSKNSDEFFSWFGSDDPHHEQALIILHPKLGQMVNGIVLPIKKVFALVDSKISVEIKDEGRKLQGRLVAVDEYLNIHMDETIEFVDNQRGRSLGTVVIRGNNILTIAPVI